MKVLRVRSALLTDPAEFTHSPFVAAPTNADFAHPLQLPSATFPHPLPRFLPRTVLVPPSSTPPAIPSNSTAGLFSLSLRGARRTLRARPSSAPLVSAVESHLVAWLSGGTYINPDQAKGLLSFPGDPVAGRDDITEVGREATRLVWAVDAGGFERYVVHCVARWHGIVSFSKDTDGHRLTYLLRPNITRPDPRPNTGVLDTPPMTDASVSDASLSDVNTDVPDSDSVPDSLSDIQESRPSSPASWSVLGTSDVDDPGFAASMESLSLSTLADVDEFEALTPSRMVTADGVPRPRPNRSHSLYPRSASSPSPARRPPHRIRKSGGRKRKAKKVNKGLAGALGTDKGSFYDYLFA